jgi:DNA-binding CsgD family transcriptional regulator
MNSMTSPHAQAMYKKLQFIQIHRQLKTPLSPCEVEVCYWLIVGKSMGEISKILTKSLSTVKHQTISIYRKFDVNTRAQLITLFFSLVSIDHSVDTK